MNSLSLFLFLFLGLASAGLAVTPTLSFEAAQPLTTAGTPINFGNHSVPRLVDWNNDGVLDLLVASGDGYLTLFRRNGPSNGTDFLAGSMLTSSTTGLPLRVGTGYTTVCFADINGDGKPDLVAAGTDDRVRYYPNTGTLVSPSFGSFTIIPGASGQFVLPPNTRARIDIADWDKDGKLDLLTGGFEGHLTLFQNTGTPTVPAFAAAGVRFARSTTLINEPHNTHPRVFDFNGDGIPDLTFGSNWGYIKVLPTSGIAGGTDFPTEYLLLDSAGASIDIRALNGDDTTPDFADLTGDGVLDVISGGVNGKLFYMRGIPHTTTIQAIEAIMGAHPADLGNALASNSTLRGSLFGYHRSLRNTALAILPLADRQNLWNWYRDHIAAYPQYFTKQQLDQGVHAYVPSLAGQVWINLFECLPDSPAHRLATANAAGFTGYHRSLLEDFGLLYVENSRSNTASQKVIHDLVASIPPSLQIVRVITQAEFLNPPGDSSINLESQKGCNVFAQLGDYSEGFPNDVPQILIDGFSVVAVHELNHNVDVAAERILPWYKHREHRLLQWAAPPFLVIRDPDVGGSRIDFPATQNVFLANGLWDGDPSHWDAAYNAYWQSGPAAGYERHWLRDNLSLCLEAPQEAFATLSNQYFTSSDTMLQLALVRWEEGINDCINQFLFFADVYALGGANTYFYRVNTAGQVTRTVVPLDRDPSGRIHGITTAAGHYDFKLDAEGNTVDLRWSPPGTPLPAFGITVSGTGTVQTQIPGAVFHRFTVERSLDLKTWSDWQTYDPFQPTTSWMETPADHLPRFYRLKRNW